MLAECCWMAGKRIFSQLPGVTVDVMMKRYGLLRFCSLTAWAIAAIPSRRWWLSKLPSGRLGVGATKMQASVHKTAYCGSVVAFSDGPVFWRAAWSPGSWMGAHFALIS